MQEHSGMIHLLFDYPTIVGTKIKDFPRNSGTLSDNYQDRLKRDNRFLPVMGSGEKLIDKTDAHGGSTPAAVAPP
jgi:hypothetical protein